MSVKRQSIGTVNPATKPTRATPRLYSPLTGWNFSHTRMEPGRIFLLTILVALALPIFVHGCHRDDEDHEPSILFPVRHADPESPP